MRMWRRRDRVRAPAMRLQPGPVVADYVAGAALLSGPTDSTRDVRAIEDLLR
jgi:hypothetical protein